MKRLTTIINLLILLLAGPQLFSQGWRKEFQSNITSLDARMVRPTFNSGFIVLTDGNPSQLIQLNAQGDTLWTRNTYLPFGLRDIIQNQDGGFTVSGGGASTQQMARFDANGNLLFTNGTTGGSGFRFNSIRETPDLGYIVTGYSSANPFGIPIARLDSLGDTLWTARYKPGFLSEGQIIESTSDGGYAIGGFVGFPGIPIPKKPIVIKTNSQGDSTWAHIFPLSAGENGWYRDIEQLPDSGYIATGEIVEVNTGDVSMLLTRLNPQGDTIWSRRVSDTQNEAGKAVVATPDGGFVVAISYLGTGPLKLIKFDSQGNRLWTEAIPNLGIGFQTNASLSLTPDGGFVFTGQAAVTGSNLFLKAVVIRTNSRGRLFSNIIQGQVYDDIDQNCLPAPSETRLDNRVMKARNTLNGRLYYALTDSAGYYELQVDTGTYVYGPDTIAPSNTLWEAPNCGSNTRTHTFNTPYDTTINDFPLISYASCPLLQVDIGAPFLRRCFPNRLDISYQNFGTATAYNPSIDVVLDPGFVVDSASIPFTSQSTNSLVTFNLDSLPPNASGIIRLYVTLDPTCTSTFLGQVKCASASIYPDTTCVPLAPNWDRSRLEVDAHCQADSIVRLVVYNRGTSNMASPGHVIIIEDNILRRNASITINAGDSAVWTFPANGATWLIQAQQSPGNPSPTAPSAFIEACGRNAQNGFSTGFAIGYPISNGEGAFASYCGELIGAFDPNYKRVHPAGMGPQHYIQPEQKLDYTLRFQNTGTDTAFTVVIIDSLPAELNPGSIVSGASSHPYTFELIGPGIARWTFSNIQLPDSNVNEPASHGYVRFSIDQAANLPLQTRINNAVGIYFDFNAPVVTDTAWVTLGEEEDYVIVSIDPRLAEQPQLRVYPNPFSSEATLDFGQELQQVKLEVFDVQGRKVVQQTATRAREVSLSAAGLPPGLYIFRLQAAGQSAGSGRLTIHR